MSARRPSRVSADAEAALRRRDSDASAGNPSRRQSGTGGAADLASSRRSSGAGANAAAVSIRRNSNTSPNDSDSSSRRRSEASSRVSARGPKGASTLESLDEKKATPAPPAVREIPRSQILLAGLKSGKSLGALFGDVFSTIKGSLAGAVEGGVDDGAALTDSQRAQALLALDAERPEDGYVRFGDSMGGQRSALATPRDAVAAAALAMGSVKEETPEDLSATKDGPQTAVNHSAKAPDAPPAVLAALWAAGGDDHDSDGDGKELAMA